MRLFLILLIGCSSVISSHAWYYWNDFPPESTDSTPSYDHHDSQKHHENSSPHSRSDDSQDSQIGQERTVTEINDSTPAEKPEASSKQSKTHNSRKSASSVPHKHHHHHQKTDDPSDNHNSSKHTSREVKADDKGMIHIHDYEKKTTKKDKELKNTNNTENNHHHSDQVHFVEESKSRNGVIFRKILNCYSSFCQNNSRKSASSVPHKHHHHHHQKTDDPSDNHHSSKHTSREVKADNKGMIHIHDYEKKTTNKDKELKNTNNTENNHHHSDQVHFVEELESIDVVLTRKNINCCSSFCRNRQNNFFSFTERDNDENNEHEHYHKYHYHNYDDHPLEPCPMLYSRIGERCIAIFSIGQVSWSGAQSFCESISGVLAVFNNIQEYFEFLEFIQLSELDSDLWIGGKTDGKSWRWIDGSLMPNGSPYWAIRTNHFTSWKSNEEHYYQTPSKIITPGGGAYQSKCASMSSKYFYYMSDEDCNDKRSPVCVLNNDVEIVVLKKWADDKDIQIESVKSVKSTQIPDSLLTTTESSLDEGPDDDIESSVSEENLSSESKDSEENLSNESSEGSGDAEWIDGFSFDSEEE